MRMGRTQTHCMTLSPCPQRTSVHLHIRSVVQVLPLAHATRALHAARLIDGLALRAGKVRAVINGRRLRCHVLGLCQHCIAVRSGGSGSSGCGRGRAGRATAALGMAAALARRQGLKSRHLKGSVLQQVLCE
jgi:hypothetical protein